MTSLTILPSDDGDVSGALLALAARIRARCVEGEGGCVIWQGATNSSGYGQIGVRRRVTYTHRIMFEIANGAIPPGKQVDHLCRNRLCCNPNHLEAVSPRENTLRGEAGHHMRAKAALIAACPQGHPYNAENTYVSKLGKRHCKRCQRERQQARHVA